MGVSGVSRRRPSMIVDSRGTLKGFSSFQAIIELRRCCSLREARSCTFPPKSLVVTHEIRPGPVMGCLTAIFVCAAYLSSLAV